MVNKISVLFLLSMFDAIFTLYNTNMGSIELNPIMKAALDEGSDVFIFLKILMTCIPLIIILVYYEKVNGFVLDCALNVVIATYVLVCLWHLYIFLIPSLTGHSFL